MNLSKLKYQFHSGEISKPEFIQKCLDFHNKLFNYIDIVKTTDIDEIRINQEGVSFLIGKEKILLYCPQGEKRVAPIEIMNFGKYESNETLVMDVLTADVSCILDVGANIGWFTILFAKHLPDVHVFSFEPVPATYAFLQRNIAANNLNSRVIAFNYGFSDKSGVTSFYIPPGNGTNASMENVSGSLKSKSLDCLTFTLDQWVNSQGIAPDFIKCDVEGAEFFVLKGAKTTIEKHHPIIFTELLRKWTKPFAYHPNDVITFFNNLGYFCFAIGDSTVNSINTVTERTAETNYVFIHPEHHNKPFHCLQRWNDNVYS